MSGLEPRPFRSWRDRMHFNVIPRTKAFTGIQKLALGKIVPFQTYISEML